ncbi:lamin tail domain-containing protein [Symbioplanes lichenis]|uniref:lamin tail domain-containing protein n=1 Tax=Symbioplanes lichenis TaxID=1629072 RepID=UPI00273A0EBB|nr:lamin tail domain-containing protein [Actinoplanes lichenis]
MAGATAVPHGGAMGAMQAAAAGGAAGATTGACYPGSLVRCFVWTGKVVRVNDGDTLDVDIAGDGTSAPRSVRLADAQAMEQSVYSSTPAKRRGDCHALAATARLEQLVRAGGGIVRLTAQSPASSSRNRPLRGVQVRIGGTWRDVGLDLVRRGLVLWQPFPKEGEWAWNNTYRQGSLSAARARINLFDTDACRTGPYQSANITANVDWRAETVTVTNHSTVRINLSRWWIRDSGLRRYTFGTGTTVAAGRSVTLHVLGAGTDTGADKFWRLSTPIFDNPVADGQGHGDGAYLFDPDGDLRAWDIYPA